MAFVASGPHHGPVMVALSPYRAGEPYIPAHTWVLCCVRCAVSAGQAFALLPEATISVALGNGRTPVRLTRIFNSARLNYSVSGQVCVANWVLTYRGRRAVCTTAVTESLPWEETAGQGPLVCCGKAGWGRVKGPNRGVFAPCIKWGSLFLPSER